MTVIPSRSELAQRLRVFESRFKRAVNVAFLLGAFGLAFGLGGVIASAVTRFEWIAPWTSGVSILIVGAAGLYFNRRRDQLTRDAAIACGACGKPLLRLNAKLALTTGRCPECGAFVIRDP